MTPVPIGRLLIGMGDPQYQRFGQRRVQAMVDLFNVFNRTPVTRVNTTYGPNWQRPQAMLTGRFVKLGAQVDF